MGLSGLSLRAQLAVDADRCVACGLCVPLCPTYQSTRLESESPRGRIVLMRELSQGRMVGAQAAARLDSCLGCMTCERVCPSNVPYARMIPIAKALAPSRPHPLVGVLRRLAGRSQRVWGLRLLLLGAQVVKPLAALLPPQLSGLLRGAPWPALLPLPQLAKHSSGPRAQLFTGCFGEVLDRDAVVAAMRLLPAAGWRLEVPTGQQCCGALAAHSGKLAEAQGFARANRAAFPGRQPVAATASGCVSTMRAAGVSGGVREAGAMLVERLAELPGGPARSARRLHVVGHVPCSQGEEDRAWIEALLTRLPGSSVVFPSGGPACCGAGGISHISHHRTGLKLALRQASALLASARPESVFVSANYACARHLEMAFKALGQPQRLRHPLALFAANWNIVADGG